VTVQRVRFARKSVRLKTIAQFPESSVFTLATGEV